MAVLHCCSDHVAILYSDHNVITGLIASKINAIPLTSTNNENISQKQEKPFEELISDLITRRKLQAEALEKIRASVEKRQSEGSNVDDNALTKKPKKLKPKR